MVSPVQLKRTLSNHRHAAPSAPWPWIDITEEIQGSDIPLERIRCTHEPGESDDCWKNYPQSHFPNWTPVQVTRSGLGSLHSSLRSQAKHQLHYLDVANDGSFTRSERQPEGSDDDAFWKILRDGKRAENTRVRAIFVGDPSLSVLKMIGEKYEVEPFFWTSSIKWIPARYQEHVQANKGDHITIVLAFPRTIENVGESLRSTSDSGRSATLTDKLEIDTQSPLYTRDHHLVLDLLGVHMIRDVQSSTLISYQPPSPHPVTSASSIHSRVYLAGQTVYWGDIFEASRDPTFVLLTILWYALFAWDQSLELLWEHIALLELDVLGGNNIDFTKQLHQIRAYLLHYASLLEDFKKSVQFILDTPNPAMDAPINAGHRDFSRAILERECKILLSHIERLSNSRILWDQRLTNIMNLAFASVNIQDSDQMKQLTRAALRDSAAMKQIAYLTMVFLPASFVASVFGMNIKEINDQQGTKGTLVHYVGTAISFTLATVWVVIALQGNWTYANGNEVGMLSRFSWPLLFVQERWGERRQDSSLARGGSAV
ncbi:hypothetical protein BU17DRAFT_86332 [Hysterangium stoloniferum]|nr:hypothetical protein BU17DRAFT_86332 [Hysterangium stoloniferum]